MSNPKGAQTQETQLYWIHCNRCFDIYIRKQRRHFLLACHHISCEKCVVIFPSQAPGGTLSYKCPICAKTVRGHQMGNTMSPQFKELFHPKPWLDDLPTIRIMHFQAKQQENFCQGMNRMQRHLSKLEQHYEVARESGRKSFEDLEHTRRKRKQMERRVYKIIEQRKMLEEQRKQREAARRLKPPPSIISSTEDSGINTVAASVGGQQRTQFHLPTRQRFRPPITAVRGINHFMPASHTYPPHAGYGPRMPSPNSSLEVQSFVHKRANSFSL